jgi:hypothetical protein
MDAAVLHLLGKPSRCEQFSEPMAGEDEVIVYRPMAHTEMPGDT